MDGRPSGIAAKPLPPKTVEVLDRLRDYTPTVPDELVLHYMRRGGDEGNDPQLVRFIALAGERFIATVLSDAMQLCRRKQQMSLQARRQLGYTGGTGKKDDKRHVLLTEDVAEALKDVGISVRNAPYFVSQP